ncbi:hypothetical protein FGIG_05755 [Fasciola gigantica]|uniref:Uncharacterized protein n=1 Tax=Fasciola gigantica TaxID=46835 RepID=A0A504YUD2_FASGI|nr:hypothetical protein FGIG_05755 [Fasciola gigantica]
MRLAKNLFSIYFIIIINLLLKSCDTAFDDDDEDEDEDGGEEKSSRSKRAGVDILKDLSLDEQFYQTDTVIFSLLIEMLTSTGSEFDLFISGASISAAYVSKEDDEEEEDDEGENLSVPCGHFEDLSLDEQFYQTDTVIFSLLIEMLTSTGSEFDLFISGASISAAYGNESTG